MNLPTLKLPSMKFPGVKKADVIEVAKRELGEIEAAFSARAKEEDRRFEEATDSEHWFCVCFQTRAQKDKFLAAMEWDEYGDKYLDGTSIADNTDIDIGERIKPRKTKGMSGRLKKFL